MSTCMGDNPQALARGLSPCTGGPNTMGLLLYIFFVGYWRPARK